MDPAGVAAAVEAVAAYGVPVTGNPGEPVVASGVLHEAIRRRDAAAAALAAATSVAASLTAGQAIFGTGFLVLPVVSLAGTDLFATALGRLDPGAGPLRRFLRDVGTVRVWRGALLRVPSVLRRPVPPPRAADRPAGTFGHAGG